ncbi:hypothetical protein MNBD_GAMMA02-625 [hydrothermal vent metagenome]|uniref:Uncharacterized protein n=1 Tax=hydrothermal vent metagenome TaxID=652676 RepID=A0A3B0VLK0_9ZZZZ
MLFLQIIGGIVVGIIGIIILFYIFIRIKFGKFLHADTNSEPLIIHLNKDINPEWIQSKKPQQYIEALKSLGFEAGDAYLIKEMEGTQLVSMHQGPICAVVYQHPLAGAWVDMVLNEVEGIEYTVSNAPMGAAFDAPDNTHKVMDPSLTTEEIYTQIQVLKNDSQKEFEPIDEENFRAFFEDAYKKEMVWRIRKGGISFDEFVKTSGESKIKTSDKNLKGAFIEMKEADLHEWQEAALEHYRKVNNIEYEVFCDDAYNMIVVPFTTAAEAFITSLENKEFISDSQAEKYRQLHSNETDIFKLFETINGHLSPELRAVFIADQDYPLKLKIYKSKEE